MLKAWRWFVPVQRRLLAARLPLLPRPWAGSRAPSWPWSCSRKYNKNKYEKLETIIYSNNTCDVLSCFPLSTSLVAYLWHIAIQLPSYASKIIIFKSLTKPHQSTHFLSKGIGMCGVWDVSALPLVLYISNPNPWKFHESFYTCESNENCYIEALDHDEHEYISLYLSLSFFFYYNIKSYSITDFWKMKARDDSFQMVHGETDQVVFTLWFRYTAQLKVVLTCASAAHVIENDCASSCLCLCHGPYLCLDLYLDPSPSFLLYLWK